MNNPLRLLTTLVACASPLAAGAARANDFPTADRVLYVQECMRAHPGPQFEMINKCSCVVDAIAAELPYDDYMTMSTIGKAMSIGGERGNAFRDVPVLEPQLKRYRELQAKSEQACFIKSGAK